MKTFISVEEAREEVLSRCNIARTVKVDLDDAAGRVLASNVVSDEDHPPFENSAMDGFAVGVIEKENVPMVLPVRGEIQAGSWFEGRLAAGTAMRIMTGAPVPSGTEYVVPVEWSDGGTGSTVTIDRLPERRANIREAGQDIRRGELVMSAGDPLGAAAVGILAMLGVTEVRVRSRPRVVIVSTGNEIVAPGERLAPGQIRNSNSAALAVQTRTAGGEVMGIFHAPDDARRIDETIGRSEGADLIVFTGGVSMGRYDLVHSALLDRGFETVFWKVRQRPGKPLLFGMLADTPVLGLPGNPVSSSVCFDQYARPAIRTMLGHREVLRPRAPATLASAYAKPGDLHVFARGIARADDQGHPLVSSTGGQGSNLFTSVLQANCLVHLPAHWTEAPVGSEVEIEWTDW